MCSTNRVDNFKLKVEMLDTFLKHAHEKHPEAKILVAGWDFYYSWTTDEVKKFIPHMDPARAYYPLIEERQKLEQNDPFCKGYVFWPESSHTDTLFLRFFTENAWSAEPVAHEEVLRKMCSERNGAKVPDADKRRRALMKKPLESLKPAMPRTEENFRSVMLRAAELCKEAIASGTGDAGDGSGEQEGEEVK